MVLTPPPGLSRRGPQAVPLRVAAVDLEAVEQRAAMPGGRGAFQFGGGGFGRMVRQHGQRGEPAWLIRVEIGREVVPGAPTPLFQRSIGNGQTEHRRTVDDRREQAVAIHIDEPLVGLRRTQAIVEQPGATERTVSAARGQAADTDDVAVDHPTGLPVGGHHPRCALVVGDRQPRGPQVDRQRPHVEVVVARVQRPVDERLGGGSGGGGHRSSLSAKRSL